MNQPKLLLCDEPTGNLDSKAGDDVIRLLTTFSRRRGVGVILVTHHAKLAEAADRTMTLRDGQVVEDTSTALSRATKQAETS